MCANVHSSEGSTTPTITFSSFPVHTALVFWSREDLGQPQGSTIDRLVAIEEAKVQRQYLVLLPTILLECVEFCYGHDVSCPLAAQFFTKK
jgi:hypothetical protein